MKAEAVTATVNATRHKVVDWKRVFYVSSWPMHGVEKIDGHIRKVMRYPNHVGRYLCGIERALGEDTRRKCGCHNKSVS